MNISLNDLKIKSTELYLCNESNSKLIYKNLDKGEVLGIAALFNGKIIEILEEKVVSKQKYFKAKLNETMIGWIKIEDSVRIYRIPTLVGKCSKESLLKLKNINSTTHRESVLTKKLLEAKYFFYYNDRQGLLGNSLGENSKLLPIDYESFHQVIKPSKRIMIELSKGTELYKDSAFEIVEDKIESDKNVRVTRYYKSLNRAQIVVEGRRYWIKKIIENATPEEENLNNVEVIDKFMYLKNMNNKLSNKLKQETKINEFIKQNISIDNNLQQLFLKKYLGDIDEAE